MTQRFATYVDVNYAAKGIVMAESLLARSPNAQLTVLCFDDAVRAIFDGWFAGRVQTLAQSSLEQIEPRLAPLRTERSPWEFYATHKAALMKHLLGFTPDGEWLAYVDADTMFFSDPSPLFDELGQASIGLSPHRYSPLMYDMEKYGRYNAGFGVWRNDVNGRQCLDDWTEQCLAWCFQRTTDDGRFMNQGYLDAWPTHYQGVVILKHSGVNLAPWNLGSHRLVYHRAGLRVDGLPVIFFHYSSMLYDADGHWKTVYSKRILNRRLILQGIYRPYLEKLAEASARLQEQYGVAGRETVRDYKAGKTLFDLSDAVTRKRNFWSR